MRAKLLRSFKQVLTIIGSWQSRRTLHGIQMVVNYMKLGHWMHDHNFNFPSRFSTREDVFAAVARRVHERRVLYLEFGVFEGSSTRYWSTALKHPESCLHGFDSFEGLPEDFDADGGYHKGRFSTDGVIPVINDHRVKFFKGWFDETLPNYTVPDHEVLVIVLDADLYSSTILALRRLKPWIREGTFIYFDDMSRPDHEPRAFDEFMKETQLKFRPVAADQSLNRAFFECIG